MCSLVPSAVLAFSFPDFRREQSWALFTDKEAQWQTDAASSLDRASCR